VPGPPPVVRADASRDLCDAYVMAHPSGCSYHRPIWCDVIGRAFGHDRVYLAAEAGRRIVGVLPLVFFRSRLFGTFAVSMPFVNYGGVLADSLEIEQALLQRAMEETRRHGGTHLELRHTRQHFAELTPKRHKVAMELRLALTVDEQWQLLDRKVRNQIRKAEKSRLQFAEGHIELLEGFYEVFARNMRDLGTPVYSARWFREILTAFPESSRIFLVRHDGRPVAASLVHSHLDTVEVPWASALRESNPVCANVFLYWQMLRSCIERGARMFDFGRSTPGEGTFHFKKQWGAEPRELVWEYWTAAGALPDVSPKNPKYSLAIRAWQRLPVPVATALGPFVVRNIP
jgi:serine/alanine adding enzyme